MNNGQPFTILLIDDEEAQLVSLQRFLTHRGYDVFTATSGEAGYKIAEKETVDLTITDFRMPGWNGLEALHKLKELNPEIDVVVLTAYGSVDDAVKIMKAGAFDYLTKPVDLDELQLLIDRVQEKHQLVAENQLLKAQLAERQNVDSIISGSSAMEEALSLTVRAAPTNTTVLIRGESGTGKELIARAIHQGSPRKGKPFETVHIAAFNDELVESELFGHEKGAFTGADRRRTGRLERANGGTLFLDEVGDIPLSVQVKLLRVLQSGQFERVGGNETLQVDARILAATHRNLEKMIKEGSFREDLYYRLNVLSVWLPPLRGRKTDIPALVGHFVSRYNEKHQMTVKGPTREAMDVLMKYSYPGNVRELENVIERAVVLTRGDHITKGDLPGQLDEAIESSSVGTVNLDAGYEENMHAYEAAMLEQALAQTDGNQSAAARLLGITERHLRYRLGKLKEDKN